MLHRADSEFKRRRTCFWFFFIKRYHGRAQDYRFSGKSNLGSGYLHGCESVATAYVVPSSSAAKDVLLEQAQKEQQTNPYNMPTGTAAPQTDATAPAESAPATEASATETPAPAAE